MVATHVREEMCVTRTHRVCQQYVSHTTGFYYTGKREAPTFYMDSTTIVGLCIRHQRHLRGLHEYENVRQRYVRALS